ncbi:phage portal protein family protein [Helicobacter heilmannii]|uniref:phage portal protein family protein n=1 Tax=Helicobacter heilmannii TaxID=35817 RepID=UPI000CF11449|nr:DUF935 family protein [Helicobacter heilmannii]
MENLPCIFVAMSFNLKGAAKNPIPSVLDYQSIKQALSTERYEELVKVYRYFLRFDAQVSSEVFKRRLLVSRLPLVLECEDERAQSAFKEIQNKGFTSFLYDCTSALFFGCAYFVKTLKDGVFNFQLIPHNYIYCENNLPFVYCNGTRVYLEEQPDVLSVCPLSVYESVGYRVISIVALKYLAMSKYMTYLENLSIPPLIAKSPDIDERGLERLLDNLEELRAASVGVFGADDQLDLLSGNVDKDAFLNFIRYCDENISKAINGQVLAGNAVEKGTQALGTVHENISKAFLEFDARFLTPVLNTALKAQFSLYFKQVPPFSLSLDTNTEIDEARQVQVYKTLYDMGVEVDLKTLEETFKVPLSRINGGLNQSANAAKTTPSSIDDKEIEELLDQVAKGL